MSFFLWSIRKLKFSAPFSLFSALLVSSLAFAQTAVVEESTTEKADTAEVATEDLPDAKEILADHLEAIGGRDKMASLKSLKMVGEMEMANMKAELTIHQTDKGQFVFQTNFPQVGEIRKGIADGFAWEMDPINGARIIEGDELKAFEREADIASSLHLDKYFSDMKCEGVEMIGDKKCYKVVMTTKEGDKETNFYDVDTKLMVRTLRKQKSAMGEIPVTANLMEYKEEDGLVFPRLTKNSFMGIEQIMRVKEIKVNADIDPKLFDIPEEIVALKKKKEEKAAKKASEKKAADSNES